MLRRLLRLLVLGAALCVSHAALVSAADAEAPKSAAIPYREEAANSSSQPAYVLLVFLGVVGAGIAGVYGLKRFLPMVAKSGPAASRLRVLNDMHLNARTRLYLCQVDDQLFLVAQSGDSVSIAFTPRSPRAAENDAVSPQDGPTRTT